MDHLVIELAQNCDFSNIQGIITPKERILECLYCGACLKANQVRAGESWMCRRLLDRVQYCALANERVFKQLFKELCHSVFEEHLRDLNKHGLIYKGRNIIVKTP